MTDDARVCMSSAMSNVLSNGNHTNDNNTTFSRVRKLEAISPSPLRGGVVVYISGRPFDWGNQVCPPIQIREISERKNGEKTR